MIEACDFLILKKTGWISLNLESFEDILQFYLNSRTIFVFSQNSSWICLVFQEPAFFITAINFHICIEFLINLTSIGS